MELCEYGCSFRHDKQGMAPEMCRIGSSATRRPLRGMSAQKEQNQERAGCKTYHFECGEFTLSDGSYRHAVATRWG